MPPTLKHCILMCFAICKCRMVTHAMELLTADNDYADMMLHEERPNFGGISIEELHRLVYAQVLCSHALAWQVFFCSFMDCTRQIFS